MMTPNFSLSRRPAFLLVSLLGSLALLTSCDNEPENPRSERSAPVLQVEIHEVETEPFQQTLGVTGSLQAKEQITLRTEMSGKVEEIHFEEGESVAEGDILLTLRNEDYQARLARSEAQLQHAEARVERLRRLIDTNAVSRADLDEAEASLAVASAEVNLAAAELNKTRILAPFDGVIGLREVSVGDFVDSNSAIASLSQLDPLRLEANIPERYQTYVRTGQEISFRIGGSPDAFAGIISAVEPGIDPGTRTIRLRATVPNPDGDLLPGSFVEGELKLDEIPAAILLPSLAVVPGLREEIVYVVEDGVATRRQVRVGFRTTDRVYIADGLEEGDEVITSGILQMRPGLRVQPLNNNASGDTDSADEEYVAEGRSESKALP